MLKYLAMTRNRCLHVVYIFGYQGWIPSRFVRKLLARSKVHRAWLAGNLGSFIEDGTKIGVCDRKWYTNRAKKINEHG